MLIRFNVKNFLSFDEMEDGRAEEFSMLAGKMRSKKERIYDDKKIKLLKFAAVYGANASGKSNLVKAINFMRTTVISGLPVEHTNKFCKVNKENKDKPSYFEMELLIEGKYYAYGFEVILSQSKFISEWLVELKPDNSEVTLFERNIIEGAFKLNGVLGKGDIWKRLDIYADDIKNDFSVLFLTCMNQNKKNFYNQYQSAKILNDVYTWIDKKLDINYPSQPISDYTYLAESNNVDKICKIISAFDTGITNICNVDIDLTEVLGKLPEQIKTRVINQIERTKSEFSSKGDEMPKLEEASIIMRNSKEFFIINIRKEEISCQTINFLHNNDEIRYSLAEESDGTIRLLDLLEILLVGEGKTYIIDEVDRCLHPCLTYKFIENYLKIAESQNIQMIVTTHESRLLDFELLRDDEIWFMSKRENGTSDIYSLEEYNVRFDRKIDKAYLEGRYGGIPIFSTVFPIGED